MLIHVLIPQYWIVLEEQRRPDIKGRPVIIASSFLEKSAAHSVVLMADAQAQTFGITSGLGLAQARHLCPEAVILSPELDLYRGIWDEILALMLAYTPLVQSLNPGEAVCDVTGCERLFGHPFDLAVEILERIEAVAGLQAVAGVGSSRLIAELAGRSLAGQQRRVAVVDPGREAEILAPLPVGMLPGIDAGTLLTFQVLGLKTVGQLSSLSISSLERRFGPLGKRLGEYARGRDDRRVCPSPGEPAVKVSGRCDGDKVEWMGPEQVFTHLAERLASELSDRLRERYLAGRLLVSTVKAPRLVSEREVIAPSVCPVVPRLSLEAEGPDQEQWFPSQEARIHSMLPQPKRKKLPKAVPSAAARTIPDGETGFGATLEAQSVVRAVSRIETKRPVNDSKTLSELANTLLQRMYPTLRSQTAGGPAIESGMELQLEMRHFAPPEQLMLPVVESLMGGARDNPRVERLFRQEEILRSRFGSSPFRHLAAVDPECVLEEHRFRWGDGIR